MTTNAASLSSLDLVGVRFSPSRPPNATWIAWGVERSGALAVEGIDPIGATFAERLAKGPPRVLGLDVPLGVPLALARRLAPMVTNGSQVMERLVASPPSDTDPVWATYSAEHPGALRLTDAITHGAPSVTAARPPLWRSLRAVGQCLWAVRDRVTLVPFDALELSPMRPTAMEVSPPGLLRLLGLPYLHRVAGDAASVSDRTAERYAVIRGLPDAVAALGARMELPAHIGHALTQDGGADALDAVLSLVSVYLATRGLWSPPPLAGPHASRVLVEGWIVRPG